jgi:hypothetical protein
MWGRGRPAKEALLARGRQEESRSDRARPIFFGGRCASWKERFEGDLELLRYGRGDTQTDLHFIHNRSTQGPMKGPAAAMVLESFGRQCLG